LKHLCVLLVAVMMCWPAICHAGVDENGHYGVLGMGNNSCGEWTKGRSNKDETQLVLQSPIDLWLQTRGVAGKRDHPAASMREIGTPRFGLVEHINAFVNESKVSIDFVDFGRHIRLLS
jgi:hypothetical protein